MLNCLYLNVLNCSILKNISIYYFITNSIFDILYYPIIFRALIVRALKTAWIFHKHTHEYIYIYHAQCVYQAECVKGQIKLCVPPTELELLGQHCCNDPMLLALQSAKVHWVRKEQRAELPHYTTPKLFRLKYLLRY